MQLFDITVPSTGNFTVHAAGRYIKYLSGNNGGGDTRLLVTPGGMGGAKITLVPGQAYRVAKDAPMPDSWTLANYAGGAVILGQVVIGNGQIDDTSIAGTVQVVDGGKTRVLTGSAMIGLVSAAAGGAGQLTHAQLWNPANSGKRLVVEQIETVSALATGFNHYVTTAALTTAQGSGNAKLFGAPASVSGLLYRQYAGAALWNSAELLTNGPTNVTSLFRPAEPFVIPPGYGWGIMAQSSNVDMTAMWEWYEEPNV